MIANTGVITGRDCLELRKAGGFSLEGEDRASMHDFLIAAAFVAIVLAPALAALRLCGRTENDY